VIALGHSASGVYLGLAGTTIASAGLIAPAALLPVTVLAGIGLHYAGDWLPHGHYRFDLKNDRQRSLIRLGLDLVLPLVLLLTLAGIKFGLGWEWGLILAALIGVHLPDIFENLVDLKVLPSGQFAKEHRAFHYDKLHKYRDPASTLPNHARALSRLDAYQFALLGLAVYLLI
jgi:hypothetical protein